MGFLFALLLLCAPVGTATASSASSAPQTQQRPSADSIYSIASTQYTYEWVSGIQPWQTRQVSLETVLPVGVIVADLVQRRRFGNSDVGGTGHFWMETWGDSYGHVHASYAPDALTMAQISVGGELYEVINDWELSGWYEWRRYANTNVNIVAPQFGRYLDRWYLRLRTSFIERDGMWVITQVAAARFYLGSADSFVEAQAGYGRNVELVAAAPTGTLEVVQSYFGTARIRHFFSRHVGASVSATYSNASFRRAGGSAGLLVRW